MRRVIDIQKQLLPDLLDVMKKRHIILKYIQSSGVIGRRTLAASVHMTERVLRGEIDFLKAQNLIEIASYGMRISEAGNNLLDQMEPIINDLYGLSDLEEQICEKYQLSQVTVVPGDSDETDYVKRELGLATVNMLRKFVSAEDVIAVTGGSTMAEVANLLTSSSHFKDCRFVPARGGLGESVELQANTIASTMAKKTGGQYRLLHVPDHLGEEAYQSLMQDANIQEIVSEIRQARIVVHGIGNALVMATRRKVDETILDQLDAIQALGEAFGYYFNQSGKVVHKMPTVGLRLEDLENIQRVVAVAGGKSKGAAIASVLRAGHEYVLITDEAAAQEILKQG